MWLGLELLAHKMKGNKTALLSGVWMEIWDAEKQDEAYNDSWVDQDAESWVFLLDGHVYRVTEDPSDGYRSRARGVTELSAMPVNWWQTSEKVRCYFVTQWPGSYPILDRDGPDDPERIEWGEWWMPGWQYPTKAVEDVGVYYPGDVYCDLLVLVSVETNKPVFILGTDNTGDYYPRFLARFYPENMGINGDLVNITGREDDET